MIECAMCRQLLPADAEFCPDCGTPVQRIRYADNETNYCPHCQTEDRLLADRALSRLLKEDWPRSIDEMTWT